MNPILSDELMLHTGAITSTHMERMPGKAAEVLGKAGLRAGDTILISSNTGINTVPVEAALYAKERGLTVVCVTSKKISRTLASRAPEGKRLYEVSDIVIDNHAPEATVCSRSPAPSRSQAARPPSEACSSRSASY